MAALHQQNHWLLWCCGRFLESGHHVRTCCGTVVLCRCVAVALWCCGTVMIFCLHKSNYPGVTSVWEVQLREMGRDSLQHITFVKSSSGWQDPLTLLPQAEHEDLLKHSLRGPHFQSLHRTYGLLTHIQAQCTSLSTCSVTEASTPLHEVVQQGQEEHLLNRHGVGFFSVVVIVAA